VNLTVTISGVYGLKCKTTNKWYVGETKRHIPDRWNGAYKSLKCIRQTKLYYALLKYGYDDFEKVILEILPPIKSLLHEREKYWIKYYDSFQNGYNLTEGGATGKVALESILKRRETRAKKPPYKHSEEMKKQIGDRCRGKKLGPRPQEVKDKIRAATIGKKRSVQGCINIGNKSKGRIHSEESKEKTRQALIARRIAEPWRWSIHRGGRPKGSKDKGPRKVTPKIL
jgi:group I intron endonuclease